MAVKIPEFNLGGNSIMIGNEVIKGIDKHGGHGFPFDFMVFLNEKSQFHGGNLLFDGFGGEVYFFEEVLVHVLFR